MSYNEIDRFTRINPANGIVSYSVPTARLQITRNIRLTLPSRLVNRVGIRLEHHHHLKRGLTPWNVVAMLWQQGDSHGALTLTGLIRAG